MQSDPETGDLTYLHPVMRIDTVASHKYSNLYGQGALLVAAGERFNHLFILTPNPAATDPSVNTTHYDINWSDDPNLNRVSAQDTLLPRKSDTPLTFYQIHDNRLYLAAEELARSLPTASPDSELDVALRQNSASAIIQTALEKACGQPLQP